MIFADRDAKASLEIYLREALDNPAALAQQAVDAVASDLFWILVGDHRDWVLMRTKARFSLQGFDSIRHLYLGQFICALLDPKKQLVLFASRN